MSLEKVESGASCVEEYEEAFHSVCKYLDQLDEKKPTTEDMRRDADTLVNKFIEAGRCCEQFFLQKHIQIADAKPEQILREECNELRQEINKKDVAINKHHEKLKNWQQSLRPGSHSVKGTPTKAVTQQQGRVGPHMPPVYGAGVQQSSQPQLPP